MLDKLLPETLFPRKLSAAAERRLRLAQARADETIIRAHVESALMFVDALEDELSFDRALDSYVRVMQVPEPLASVVVTRALVVLGDQLLPQRRIVEAPRDGERPKLRLADGSDRTRRPKQA